MSDSRARLRDLPAVHELLDLPSLLEAQERWGRTAVREAVRSVLDTAREHVLANHAVELSPSGLVEQTLATLQPARPCLRPVINATGVLLNTGLGRAPLAKEAVEAIQAVARGYCNLEFDLDQGERGRRTSGVAALLRQLFGCESAAVVNNNAAATILALRALANGREVIVSRGQLVEIGGSFRLPEIFAVSGARLCEVGTTNKTRISDYERAITDQTATLLRVHTSNFQVVGFTESVAIEDLVKLGRSRGIWTIDDIGSGAIDNPPEFGLAHEPTIAASLKAGADVVLFSGDKLLGGPQSGLILGASEPLKRISTDPLMRAFRVDKLTLAALEATLRLFLVPGLADRAVPLRRFLFTPIESLQQRAEALAASARRLGWKAAATPCQATVGGGSLPGSLLPSWGVRIDPDGGETELLRQLRLANPSLVARAQAGAILIDLKAVDQGEDALIERLLAEVRGTPAVASSSGSLQNREG